MHYQQHFGSVKTLNYYLTISTLLQTTHKRWWREGIQWPGGLESTN